MKILVFISKHTGLAMLETLYHIPDEYLFVLGPKDVGLIQESLDSKGFEHIGFEAFRSQDFLPESFDWLLNLWGSHIFSNSEIQLAKKSLNIHPSYLPQSKGSDPVLWSQINGLPQGVTLHAITEQLDSGPIYVRQIVDTPMFSAGIDNYEKVVSSCIALFAHAWPDIRSGVIKPFLPDETADSIPNKRNRTLAHQNRDYDQLEGPQKELLGWLLAYNYGLDFLPTITMRGVVYKLNLTVHGDTN
jgi:hypothetical protein